MPAALRPGASVSMNCSTPPQISPTVQRASRTRADANGLDAGCWQSSGICTDWASCSGHTGALVIKARNPPTRSLRDRPEVPQNVTIGARPFPRSGGPVTKVCRLTYFRLPAAGHARTPMCAAGWSLGRVGCDRAWTDLLTRPVWPGGGGPERRTTPFVGAEADGTAGPGEVVQGRTDYRTIRRFVGGLGGSTMVNVHVKSAASGRPALSVTPLAPPLIVAR